jgi:hypothetical protein
VPTSEAARALARTCPSQGALPPKIAQGGARDSDKYDSLDIAGPAQLRKATGKKGRLLRRNYKEHGNDNLADSRKRARPPGDTAQWFIGRRSPVAFTDNIRKRDVVMISIDKEK